jgi:anthranilate phosphoribosyltransferase
MSDVLSDVGAFKGVLAKLADSNGLPREDAALAFDIMMSGGATSAQIGAFLMGLHVRGETVDEIVAGAGALRAKMTTVDAPADAMDVVGTGGDNAGTFNVSTATALVVAAAGQTVAKHGNRAASSKSGSADVLMALGVNLECEIALIEAAIREAHIGFMMAPRHHAAMRHVADARRELGVRTIFNLLGPLANPANVKRLLIGVFARQWLAPLAEVMRELGAERVWVVHGRDGLDELTTTGPSLVTELNRGQIRSFEVNPEAAGLPLAKPRDLLGGDATTNAKAISALFDGKTGAFRDIVLLNSAAALVVAERAEDLKDGVRIAAEAIDSGAARVTLDKLIEITNRANAPGGGATVDSAPAPAPSAPAPKLGAKKRG